MRKRDPEKNRLHQKAWRDRHPEKNRAAVRASQTPEMLRANQAVYRAIKRGDLVRGECEVGEGCYGSIQAHHDDYSKPLDVRWLCRRHHRLHHLRHRER